MENCFHPRHPRLRKGSGWGPPAPWMWKTVCSKVAKGPVESTVFDGFGWFFGFFFSEAPGESPRTSRCCCRTANLFLPQAAGRCVFVFFPCVVFWFGMNPNFPISQPQGFDSPCHCWHLCAFILGRKPLSAGLKPLEFWSFKLRLPQSAKTAASLHQLEKTLRPRLPDLFEALKCRNKLNKFHCFLTYLNHMEKARQCSTPLLFCQRLPRHAWGWEETTTNRLQSCTPLLLVLSHRDVSWNELHHFGPVITEGWTATSLERGLYQANKVNLEIKWSLEVNQWNMMDHERWH